MRDSAGRGVPMQKRAILCLSFSFVLFFMLLPPSTSHGRDPVVVEGSEWTTSGVLKEKVKKSGKVQTPITLDLIFGPSTLAASEALEVPACGFDAVVTEHAYSGLVRLMVTGSVTGGTSPPRNRHDGFYEFNGNAVESPAQFRYARASQTTCTCQLECNDNFPVADLLAEAYPPFNVNHGYTVLLDLGDQPDQLAFGIRDCGCFDNTGGLQVTIDQALAANEFLLIADDGEERLLFPGTYAANSKGKPTLFPDIEAFEDSVQALLEEIFKEMFPSGEIQVEIRKIKLKAKPKSKNGVETIKLTLKAKFVVNAQVDGTSAQTQVTWSYKESGGRR